MEITGQSLKFHTDALGENALVITRLTGEEQLSGPFRFELDLVSTDEGVKGEDVLYQPAKVGLLQRLANDLTTFRWFSGTVASFYELERGQGFTSYRAVLVPDLWKATEFHRSRIFQEMTIDELVTSVLNEDLQLQSGQDFEFKLTRAGQGDRKTRDVYPEREYVVQWEETDLAFVSRWLEHEGIFYFFDNDGDREKVVFADAVSAYKPVVPGASAYPYRPAGAGQTTVQSQDVAVNVEEVQSFTCLRTRQPKKVALDDYNWREPQAPLKSEHAVHAQGLGIQREYNDHYKSQAQGKALAQVRAEERTCRAAVFHGRSTCRAFRPGKTFELTHHFRPDYCGSYLLVSVHHEGEQAVNLNGSVVTGAHYHNTFQAIPASATFRPERVTPWPSIRGVMHGRVDAEGGGDLAELDGEGRYKVWLPFDENKDANPDGKSSRWIRMAQPYAGPKQGFHFPLLKGTEVLITHIDGDPDRPVIAAAIPNPDTPSLVDSSNHAQNVIQTTSGNQIIIDDSHGGGGFVFKDVDGSIYWDLRSTPEDPMAALADFKGKQNIVDWWDQNGDYNDSVIDDALAALISKGAPVAGSKFSGAGQIKALRVWLEHRTTIEQGDRFSYADVGNAYSFGTGGYSFHQETGDTDSESTHDGNSKSRSIHNGDSDSHSEVTGNSKSYSKVDGDTDDESWFFGHKKSHSFSFSTSRELSLAFGAKAGFELNVSGKVAAEVNVGAAVTLAINAGASTAIEITAAGKYEISVNPIKAIFGVETKGEYNIPKKDDYTLQRAKGEIQGLYNQVNRTENNVFKLNNDLQQTKNQLQTTENQLQSTKQALQKSESALQKSQQELQTSQTALQKTQTELQGTVNALKQQDTSLQINITSLCVMLGT